VDRLEAMSILLEAVESGSLSAAGRRLNMPLASVSRKVADLEAHLRTRLFNRSTRRLTLTDAGLLYVAAARRILDDLNEAERTAAGEYSAPQGELVITAPVMFGRLHMLPVVTAFLRAYPDVDVRLLLTDRLAPLLEEHVDLAVRIAPLADSSLVALRLGVIRRVVCASRAYLAKHGTPQRPEELARHDCINFVFPRSSTAWTFGFGKAEIEVQVRSRLIVTTAEAAIDAATEGGRSDAIAVLSGGAGRARRNARSASRSFRTRLLAHQPRAHRSGSDATQAPGLPRLCRTQAQGKMRAAKLLNFATKDGRARWTIWGRPMLDFGAVRGFHVASYIIAPKGAGLMMFQSVGSGPDAITWHVEARRHLSPPVRCGAGSPQWSVTRTAFPSPSSPIVMLRYTRPSP